MCTTYYQKSMSGLVSLMTANHIHPVILEIPDYDILKTYERQKRQKKLLRRLSMLLTGTPIDCKQMFRKAFAVFSQP